MKRNKERLGSNRFGYLLLVPSAALILLISVYPLLSGVYMSFTNQSFLKPNQNDFIGLANYAKLIQDTEFLGAAAFSFVLTFFVVLLGYVIGLALAIILNRKIPLRGLLRALLLLPWVIPAVVGMINWSWLLNDQIGFINTALKGLGLIDNPILFLADYKLIRPTVILVCTWKTIPFMMITVLSGLQSIPVDLYEAANIDGAGFWRALRHITLPMVKSVSFVCITLSFIWTFNNFENIWLLTGGGPNGHTYTLPILSYYTAFYRNNTSYAATIATAILVAMLALCILYMWLQTRGDDRPGKTMKASLKGESN